MPSQFSEQSDPEPPSSRADFGLRVEIIAGPSWPSALETSIHTALQVAYSKLVNEVFELSSSHDWELAVALISDNEIQVLNRDWRGKDNATNVLSFPSGILNENAPEDPTTNALNGMEVSLGDIALAWETVYREADEETKPLQNHVQHLAIHGLLHIFGFDHETVEEAEEMEALEIEILGELGIPNPYLNGEIA